MKKIICLLMLIMTIMLTVSTAETASYINSIDFSTKNGATTVNIYLSSPATFTEGKLTATNKIFFDFQNTILRKKININVKSNNVQAIRAAQNTVKPSYISRVVLDMDKLADYSLLVSKDGKKVSITFGEEKKTTSTNTSTKVENKVEETTSRGEIDREERKSEPKVIVIDAGHGGKDPGAVFSSVYEKSLNLDIAKRLRKLLQAKGYKVIMTRTSDKFIELTERANIANTKQADLFISIHNNSMPDGYSGVMTLYSTRDSKEDFTSKNLAEAIQESMVKTLKTKSIGARERDNLVVLNKTTMPAVIVEVGCMSDSSELKQLKKASFRQKAAKAICNAVDSLEF